jgi:hypothetical protein
VSKSLPTNPCGEFILVAVLSVDVLGVVVAVVIVGAVIVVVMIVGAVVGAAAVLTEDVDDGKMYRCCCVILPLFGLVSFCSRWWRVIALLFTAVLTRNF